jgi:5-methylthioribose kinase
MEDLGVSSDFTDIYRKEVDVTKAEIAELTKIISELHTVPLKGPSIQNVEMKRLNHSHIFELPLVVNNGFDLNSVVSGLHEGTEKFRGNARLQQCANNLGNIYLNGGGEKLLHGDFYPGSWLRTKDGIKIIDPEFCFHGKPEFELGVMIAHLKLAQQTSGLMKDLFVYYHFDSRFDGSLFTKFAGMEMIRRLIGLAQLPLDLTLKERLDMLDEAYELVIHG